MWISSPVLQQAQQLDEEGALWYRGQSKRRRDVERAHFLAERKRISMGDLDSFVTEHSMCVLPS
jgi:hypothetical protein